MPVALYNADVFTDSKPSLTSMPTEGSDPFADPAPSPGDDTYAEGSTLAVGRGASLTLATDSLIVLGELLQAEDLMGKH